MDLRSAAFFNSARTAFLAVSYGYGDRNYTRNRQYGISGRPPERSVRAGGGGFPLTDIILRTKSRAIRAQRRAEDITGTNAKRLTLEDQPPAI